MAKKGTGTRTKRAPENETKEAKFIRLGEARLAKALKAIGQIGNLASPSYKFNNSQVKVIFTHLANAVEAAGERFTKQPKPASEGGISLAIAEEGGDGAEAVH